MSRNYSLEDVETLRSKANISYDEAVKLLDQYDGDLARALIELEKRAQTDGAKADVKFDADEVIEWLKKMWHKGLNTHVVIERKNERLLNLPMLFLALMLILGPYAIIAAAIFMLVTGCSVSLKDETLKKQTIHKGDDQASAKPADIEPAIKPDAPDKTDDDDIPTIIIS